MYMYRIMIFVISQIRLSSFPLSIIACLALTRNVRCVGTPFGFAAHVTGGGSLTPQAPGDIGTLKTWLEDDQPRVILIDKMYDFTDTEGNTTGPGCEVWPPCKNGRQVQTAIDYHGWCGQQKNSKSITVNYRKAALNPLIVRSNKSILGRGPLTGIKGKGLRIDSPDKNIIIQGIKITFINPDKVWGGDGIVINGGKDIWIDHCTFTLIGRQMIVSMGHHPNTGITISHNRFDGKTSWSFDCSDQHYWTIFLEGSKDQATIAKNCFSRISGRCPKIASDDPGGNAIVHHYNNYHHNSRGEVMEIGKSGRMLAEGNVLDDVGPGGKKQAQSKFEDGEIFAAFSPSDASICNGKLGRACITNEMSKISGDGGSTDFGKDLDVLDAMKAFPEVKEARVESSAGVASRKYGQCGAGAL